MVELLFMNGHQHTKCEGTLCFYMRKDSRAGYPYCWSQYGVIRTIQDQRTWALGLKLIGSGWKEQSATNPHDSMHGEMIFTSMSWDWGKKGHVNRKPSAASIGRGLCTSLSICLHMPYIMVILLLIHTTLWSVKCSWMALRGRRMFLISILWYASWPHPSVTVNSAGEGLYALPNPSPNSHSQGL